MAGEQDYRSNDILGGFGGPDEDQAPGTMDRPPVRGEQDYRQQDWPDLGTGSYDRFYQQQDQASNAAPRRGLRLPLLRQASQRSYNR